MDLCVKEWGNLMECNGSTRVQTPKWFVNGNDLGNTFKMIDETSSRCLVVFMPTKRWHKMKNSGNMEAQTQDGSGEIQKIPTT